MKYMTKDYLFSIEYLPFVFYDAFYRYRIDEFDGRKLYVVISFRCPPIVRSCLFLRRGMDGIQRKCDPMRRSKNRNTN